MSKDNINSQFNKLKSYLVNELTYDLFAGFTVAIVAIPQSMAYASIIGINPIYGLYTAIIPAIVASIFGRSAFLITGPTNATALVTASVLLLSTGSGSYIEFVFFLAIIAGLIKLIIVLFKLGDIIRFVSNSVFTSFLTGACLLIVLSQMTSLLGLSKASDPSLITNILHLLSSINKINIYVVITSLISIVTILVIRKVNRNLPSSLIAIFVTSCFVWFINAEIHGISLVRDLGSVNPSISFHLPILPSPFPAFLIPGGLTIALISLLESTSISKSIAASSQQTIDLSRDFIGQGLASFIGGFFQCIPPSGSLARSAVAYRSNAKTSMTGVFSGLFVLLCLLLFSRWISYIPVACLAGIIIISAISLIDQNQIKLIIKSRKISLLVFITTLIMTLILPLQYGILIGIFLSSSIYMFESSRIHITQLKFDNHGNYFESPLPKNKSQVPECMIVNIEGEMFFGATEGFFDRLEGLLTSKTIVIIFRLRNARHLSTTAVIELKKVIIKARSSGIIPVFCGLSEESLTLFNKSGLTQLNGKELIFPAQPIFFESTRKALVYSKKICEKKSYPHT